jgi:hypothetical protein
MPNHGGGEDAPPGSQGPVEGHLGPVPTSKGPGGPAAPPARRRSFARQSRIILPTSPLDSAGAMAETPCDYARRIARVNARRQVSGQDSQDDSQAESFPGPDLVRTLFSGIGSCEKG